MRFFCAYLCLLCVGSFVPSSEAAGTKYKKVPADATCLRQGKLKVALVQLEIVVTSPCEVFAETMDINAVNN